MFKSCGERQCHVAVLSRSVPMAVVGGTGKPLPQGTRFLAISGILVFALVSSWKRGYCGHFFDWHSGIYFEV